MFDTAVGEAVNKELKEYVRCHQAKPKAFQEEMGQALKDKEVGKELEVVVRELQPPEFLLVVWCHTL